MEEEKENLDQNLESKKEEAGCFGIGFSFICPAVGFVLHFMERKKIENAKSYLWASIAGMILSAFLKTIVQ